MFTFGLPRAKNSVVFIRKRFKLRGESYQEASHALTCLRISMPITITTVWRFRMNFWVTFGHFGIEIFFSKNIG